MYSKANNRYKDLFLQQSYLDAGTEYERSLTNDRYPVWDFVVLTASNERQAEAYREQIRRRLVRGRLPAMTRFEVFADPDEKRVGSGGATLNVLRQIRKLAGNTFADKRIFVIHSGGDSKRIPQYSVCGKLFAPVPRKLADGRSSTLFDEFIIAMTAMPARIPDGMLVVSGDVLLLFNPLQIDFYAKGAAALSVKTDVETARSHGAFLVDSSNRVLRFLHKQSPEKLAEAGAVDAEGGIDLDTGAVFFDRHILDDLFLLINTPSKFNAFVNEKVRLSFYTDFLFPLAEQATLRQFYNELPEGDFSDDLKKCRTAIWKKLRKYRMQLLHLSPGSFMHFGTTREFLRFISTDLDEKRFLGWTRQVNTNLESNDFAANNSLIVPSAKIGKNSYLEDCTIGKNVRIGEYCVISGLDLENVTVPDRTVLQALPLLDGSWTVRKYGIDDNPKLNRLFNMELDQPLWTAPVHPIAKTMKAALEAALTEDRTRKTINLQDALKFADLNAILQRHDFLDAKIKAESFCQAADRKVSATEANSILYGGTKDNAYEILCEKGEKIVPTTLKEFGRKMRIFRYLAELNEGDEQIVWNRKCFETVREAILDDRTEEEIAFAQTRKIQKDSVEIHLPLRVNWGGGWSDTPPYCLERGGTVLNAAITLNGLLPVDVILKRIERKKVILSSGDSGATREFSKISDLQDCSNPYDNFSLHKAALLAYGVIPNRSGVKLTDLFRLWNGGLQLTTTVRGVPRGSGLGTSSILAAGCIRALAEFFGEKVERNLLYRLVLRMEQIMTTGGGWQDQAGGLAKGINLFSSAPGLVQNVEADSVRMSSEPFEELRKRFCLVYTGQRRLARHLLRDVMGKYIAGNPETVQTLEEIRKIAVLMRFELEKGEIDGFVELLNRHWVLSKQLDAGCSNTCIEHILYTCGDLAAGKMICGAGGGGFLQIVLKKGVEPNDLRKRLKSVYGETGVDIWPVDFHCVTLLDKNNSENE